MLAGLGFPRVVDGPPEVVDLGAEPVLLVSPLAPGLFVGLAQLPQLVHGRLPLAGQPLELARLRGELLLASVDLPGELFSAGVQGMERRLMLADPRAEPIAFGVGGSHLVSKSVEFL